MSHPDSLLTAQRDFARLVTAVDAQEEPECPRIRSDLAIPALARVSVYAHAYFERIHAVLREDYCALHAALGDDGFHDLARLYLLALPSRSFSLRHAGARLAEFLRGPVAEVFARRWPFAADLALLECALVDVFDAVDAPVLERAALAEIPAQRWPELRFALVRAQQRLRLDWPVQQIREAWSRGFPLPEISPSPTAVLVWRQREQVHLRALQPLEADAIALVDEGADFATLCASVVEATGEDDAALRVLALLERWVGEGLLRSPLPDAASAG